MLFNTDEKKMVSNIEDMIMQKNSINESTFWEYNGIIINKLLPVGCPFHDEQLLILRYKDKAVPYSIDFTPTEAYSAMQAREKQPAKRYIDICYLLKN